MEPLKLNNSNNDKHKGKTTPHSLLHNVTLGSFVRSCMQTGVVGGRFLGFRSHGEEPQSSRFLKKKKNREC